MNRRAFLKLGIGAAVSVVLPLGAIARAPQTQRVFESTYEIDLYLLEAHPDPDMMRKMEDDAQIEGATMWAEDQGFRVLSTEVRKVGNVWIQDCDGGHYKAERRYLRAVCVGSMPAGGRA